MSSFIKNLCIEPHVYEYVVTVGFYTMIYQFAVLLVIISADLSVATDSEDNSTIEITPENVSDSEIPNITAGDTTSDDRITTMNENPGNIPTKNPAGTDGTIPANDPIPHEWYEPNENSTMRFKVFFGTFLLRFDDLYDVDKPNAFGCDINNVCGQWVFIFKTIGYTCIVFIVIFIWNWPKPKPLYLWWWGQNCCCQEYANNYDWCLKPGQRKHQPEKNI